MAAEDRRIPVLIGTHKIPKKNPEGGDPVITDVKAISLMTQRVATGLGLTKATPEELEGVEIETDNNGSYFTESLGSVSAQIITVIRSTQTPKGRNATYNFSVPRFFPSYKLRVFLEGKGDAIAFKRNGRRIFLGTTTQQAN